MPVLICKNITGEGPGTIEDFLIRKKIPYTIVDLSQGETIRDPSTYDTLVMLGGPMSVNDDGYPFIRMEEELVRKFISQNRRVFGICLGAQIMAKALGARVYPGREKEIGWYDIQVTADGLKDTLMSKLALHPHDGGLADHFKVFQWHGETFDLPEGAVKLAGSALYPNQAFRHGKHAYAFQFHIEARNEMVFEWLKDEKIALKRIRKETDRFSEEYHGRALQFYESFFAGA